MRRGWAAALLIAGCLLLAEPADAAVGRAFASWFAALFQLPGSILAGTFNGPPVIGTLMGAVNGVFRTFALVGGGAAELGGSAVSIAKAIGPYLLPFLL